MKCFSRFLAAYPVFTIIAFYKGLRNVTPQAFIYLFQGSKKIPAPFRHRDQIVLNRYVIYPSADLLIILFLS